MRGSTACSVRGVSMKRTRLAQLWKWRFVAAFSLAATSVGAWVWGPAGARVPWTTTTFFVGSDLASRLRWVNPDDVMTQSQAMGYFDRAVQSWNRYSRGNFSLEVNPTPSPTLAHGLNWDYTSSLSAEDQVCPGPFCCAQGVPCAPAHSYLWPSLECDISVIGRNCAGPTCLCASGLPPNCNPAVGPGWFTGQGQNSTPASGLVVHTFHRTLVHELSHCLGALDPLPTAPPCAEAGASNKGPANCQTRGAATLEVLADDIDAVRNPVLGYGGPIVSPIRFRSGAYAASGAVTLSAPNDFALNGAAAPTSATFPRIDCFYDEAAPDCAMVGTDAAGRVVMWNIYDQSAAAGAQLAVYQSATVTNGRALRGADIAMVRRAPTATAAGFSGAVVAFTNDDAMTLVVAGWNWATNTIVFNTVLPLAEGTFSKYSPRVTFDRTSNTFVVAVVDSMNRFEFFVSNGPNVSAAGFGFGPPRLGSPHPNGPTTQTTKDGSSMFDATALSDDQVVPVGGFDIGCGHQQGSGNCRLVFHNYGDTVQDKNLQMAVCYFAVGYGWVGGVGACNYTSNNADAEVVTVHDYQSSVSGGPSAGWVLGVGRKFPGFTENSAMIFDTNGTWNPPGLGTLFDVPGGAKKFRAGGASSSFCRWTGCNAEIVLTLGCGGDTGQSSCL